MPEPPADGAATGNPSDGAGATEYAELRRLIVGHDLERLAALQQRLDDPAVRGAETGDVLPEAVRSAHGRHLREALEPVFEKSFQNSVRKHPKELSDAIYPVMGPAIRASIAAAIREFAESMNQIVEKSASWRAIRWRLEARATGRPFTEILLTRSLLYSVEQVFLIHRKSGLLLMHLAADSAVVKDADMVSGMFTAIQDFVSDSFSAAGQELETIDVGRYKLWIQYGSKALLVGAVSGTAPVELKGVFRSALEKIHAKLFAPLDTFKQDDLNVFEPARPYLQSCLLGQKTPDKRKQILPWLALVAVIGLLGAWALYEVETARRWNGYVNALRNTPGIAILRAERDGTGGLIEGLKDPQAPDPAGLLGDFDLDRSKLTYQWHPYLFPGVPFAAERATQADLDLIRGRIVRFEVGSAALQVSQAALVDELAAAIRRLIKTKPDARIEITGHTDEVGSVEANSKLSQDRASAVSRALVAEGIPAASVTVRGAGNGEPLRTGETEWDKAANRSVSFRVTGVNSAAGPPG